MRSNSHQLCFLLKSIPRIEIVVVRADDHLPCHNCDEYGPVTVICTPGGGSIDVCRECLHFLRSYLVTRKRMTRIAANLRKVADDMEALAS